MKISYEDFCKKMLEKDKKMGMFAIIITLTIAQQFKGNIDNEIDLDELEKYIPGITKELLGDDKDE